MVLCNSCWNFARETKYGKFIVSKEALSLIAKNSEGSIRDSLTILDQCILNSNKENVEESDVIETIGLTSQKFLFDLFCSIVEGEIIASVNILNKIYEQGADPKMILEDLLNLTYDFMSMVTSKKDNNDLYIFQI